MSTDTDIAQLKDNIEVLKELYTDGALDNWETQFAESVIKQYDQRPLSEKQMDKIAEIVNDGTHDKQT
jgi:hypothetical protein